MDEQLQALIDRGPHWADLDSGVTYGQYQYHYDDDGLNFYFVALPEPDALAGESAIVQQLATVGGMGAQYPSQYFTDPRYLSQMRAVAAYLRFVDQLTGQENDWYMPISRAWRAQLTQFGPWSTFDDAGQTALKIIAQSGLPNARELSDAIRQTTNFQQGQAAMARAWNESNQASNLLSLVTEIVGDIGTLASSGGFRIIMLPFAVTGALNLANSLAQNGLTETIRQTAQSAASSLNNALSFAQSADAATVAAEQAAQIAAEQAAQQAAQIAAEQAAQQSIDWGMTIADGEAFAQAVENLPIDMTGFYTPDILTAPVPSFIETIINPASLPVNPAADLLIDFAPSINAAEWLQVTPDVDMTGFHTPDMLDQPAQKPFVETVTNPADLPVNTAEDVLIDLPTGASEWTAPLAINDFGQGAAALAPVTAGTVATATTGAGITSALTQAAAAVKAGAGLLAIAMGAGSSATPRPNALQPGQPGFTSADSLFSTSAARSMLIPLAVLGVALLAAKGTKS